MRGRSLAFVVAVCAVIGGAVGGCSAVSHNVGCGIGGPGCEKSAESYFLAGAAIGTGVGLVLALLTNAAARSAASGAPDGARAVHDAADADPLRDHAEEAAVARHRDDLVSRAEEVSRRASPETRPDPGGH